MRIIMNFFNDYIVKSYDEEQQWLVVEIVCMGEMVVVQFDVLMDVIEKCDENVVQCIIVNDEVIDSLEQQISYDVMCLVLCGLMVCDFCEILVGLCILVDIECIGDYVVNVVKCLIVLSKVLLLLQIQGLCLLGWLVVQQVCCVIEVYCDNDVVVVFVLCDDDVCLDVQYIVLFCELFIYMMEDLCNIIFCMYLLFMVKNLECVGDYVINIVENVWFLVYGEQVLLLCEKCDEISSIDYV